MNIVKVQIQSKLSYERNKERILSYQKEYNKTHHEQTNERSRKNYIKHHSKNLNSLKSLCLNIVNDCLQSNDKKYVMIVMKF